VQEYNSKQELIAEIEKTAKLFITEFDGLNENEANKVLEGVDRTPMQMIAYQLGWMNLIMSWDEDESLGKEVITPTPEYKWNNLGGLYDSFSAEYANFSLQELKDMFVKIVNKTIVWINTFSEQELFEQNVRKWASSTPSKWAIWKWVHINTVAPFKSFRSKIRKWKRLNREE
jgi:hypothetical protein